MLLGTTGFAVCDADVHEGSTEKPHISWEELSVPRWALLPAGISLPADQPHSSRVLLRLLKLNLRDYLQRVAPIFSPDQFLSLLLLCSCVCSCTGVMEGAA